MIAHGHVVAVERADQLPCKRNDVIDLDWIAGLEHVVVAVGGLNDREENLARLAVFVVEQLWMCEEQGSGVEHELFVVRHAYHDARAELVVTHDDGVGADQHQVSRPVCVRDGRQGDALLHHGALGRRAYEDSGGRQCLV